MMNAPKPGPRPGSIPTPAQAIPNAVDPETLFARLENQELAEQVDSLEELLGQLTRALAKAQG